MYRIQLSDDVLSKLSERARERTLDNRERDRIEMLRLSNAGWSVPRIARHLGLCEQTVRRRFQAYLVKGLDALPCKRAGGRPRRVLDEHLLALEGLLDSTEQTWSSSQLSEWLKERFQVQVGPSHLSRLLKRRGFRYKRTKTSVQHKADERQQQEKAAELAALEKSGQGTGDRSVLPRRERLRSHASDHLHLGAQGAPSHRPI